MARKLCKEYSNPGISLLIDEWIHSKRDREILKMCYVDKIPDERIAEITGMSPRRIFDIINDGAKILNRHL